MFDFFIGIRLPTDLEEIFESYRRKFKAPRTVAHITLIAPFAWTKETKELVELLHKASYGIAPFQVSGQKIGSFGSRVLFVDVNLSSELKTLNAVLANSLGAEGVAVDTRPYRPHITLATRLKEREFANYKNELANFEPDYFFLCTKVTLFKFTQERRWKDCESIPLNGAT